MLPRCDSVRWTILAALLFVEPVLFWWNEPPARRLHDPRSPFDLTNTVAAKRWTFLESARRVVPTDASITIQATNLDDEMSLYMFALGLYPEHRVVPRSYWGAPVTPRFHADYELSYGCADRRPDQRVIAEITDGCVREATR